jgi:hypothetical protein
MTLCNLLTGTGFEGSQCHLSQCLKNLGKPARIKTPKNDIIYHGCISKIMNLKSVFKLNPNFLVL